MSTFFYVPLKSIALNRDGPADALAMFAETRKAVEFSPGEIAMIMEDNGGTLDGVLRDPQAEEMPSFAEAAPLIVAESDQGDEPLPPIEELNALAEANIAAGLADVATEAEAESE